MKIPNKQVLQQITINHLSYTSAANKYYFSAGGHHEQKIKKTTGQIKFLPVTIKQQKKLDILHVKECWWILINDTAVAQFCLQYFLSSQTMYEIQQSIEVLLQKNF